MKSKTANGGDVWNPNQPMAVADDNALMHMKLDIVQSGLLFYVYLVHICLFDIDINIK